MSMFKTKELKFDYSSFKTKRTVWFYKFYIDGKWIKYNRITNPLEAVANLWLALNEKKDDKTQD